MTHRDNAAGDVAAWIALVLAIAALIFAWVAYNRAGENLETQIRQETEEVIEQDEFAPENDQQPAEDDNDGLLEDDDGENDTEEDNDNVL